MAVAGMRHFVGLDLGQAHQYSALTVLERRIASHGRTIADVRPCEAIRHLDRFAPGTPYPEIAAAVRDVLKTQEVSGAMLMVDVTGVGKAVKELFYDELWNRVTCTFVPLAVVGSGPVLAGGSPSCGIPVPKLELVGTMQVLLQTKRLKIADSLPEAAVLVRELEMFPAATPVLRGESVEQWRERDHDDLVLAVALAAWVGEQNLPDRVE
jgi:hypothetical protein